LLEDLTIQVHILLILEPVCGNCRNVDWWQCLSKNHFIFTYCLL